MRSRRRWVVRPALEAAESAPDPAAYFRAIEQGVCPYDDTGLETDDTDDAEQPKDWQRCPKCGRGFAPTTCGGDADPDELDRGPS